MNDGKVRYEWDYMKMKFHYVLNGQHQLQDKTYQKYQLAMQVQLVLSDLVLSNEYFQRSVVHIHLFISNLNSFHHEISSLSLR